MRVRVIDALVRAVGEAGGAITVAATRLPSAAARSSSAGAGVVDVKPRRRHAVVEVLTRDPAALSGERVAVAEQAVGREA